MPAVSKAQQRFMGMVHAADKGETPASPEVAKVSADMKDTDAKDFASTKHDGLPDHVKEQLKSVVREVIREKNGMNEMSGNDVHFKHIMKMYDRGGSFTKKKIGAVVCKDPKASRKDIEEVLFDSDYRDIVEFEDELGLKEIREKYSSVNEEFKHTIHVDTPTQVISKPVAAQIMALAKKGVRASEIGLEMGFVGNAKLATDTFQKVKNQIYFALDKRNESINELTYNEKRIKDGNPNNVFYAFYKGQFEVMYWAMNVNDLFDIYWDKFKVKKPAGAKFKLNPEFIIVSKKEYDNSTSNHYAKLKPYVDKFWDKLQNESVNEVIITEDTKRVTILGIDFNISEMNGRIFFSFVDKKAASIKIREIGTNKIVNLIQKSLDNAYGKGEFFFKSGDHAEFQNGYLFQRNATNINLNKLKFESINEDIKSDVNKFLDKLNKEFPDQEYTTDFKGGKYARITHQSRKFGQPSAWGFIAMDDNPSKGFQKGDLLKAAGFNTPAKHARGNILKGDAKYDKYSPTYLKESVNEAFSDKKVDAKIIADKMRKNSSTKSFADKVEKLGKVSAEDLDKMLPDFVAGSIIASLFKESVNEGSHGMATKLLQSIVSGDSSRAEGTKMSKELAQHYIDWIRTSPFGKKNGNLPLDMLVKASFNWGIERGLDSKLKGELSKLKSTIKESVNEVSDTAYTIHRMTDAGQNAVQNFIDDNGLDAEKLLKYIKSNPQAKYDVRDYIAGKKGTVGGDSKLRTKFIKMFKESVNEAPQKVGNVNAFGASKVLGKGKKVLGFVADTPNAVATLIQDFPQAMEIEFKQGFFSDGKLLKSIKKGDKVWKELEKRYIDKQTKDAMKAGFSINEEHDCGCNENHDCGCGGVHEHIHEDLSADANGIAGLTASRATAVEDFLEKNNINSNKLYLFLKKGNLKDRMDFVTALVGKPGNPIQKKVISQFSK